MSLADAADATHFTLADFTSGETTYRLTGAVDVRKYFGKGRHLTNETEALLSYAA